MRYERVNNLAASLHKIRKRGEASPLETYYKVIYSDAFIPLKRNKTYSKEAVHVMYGVKGGNTQALLLLDSNPTESADVWGDYYKKLKARGLQQVDLVVTDGLRGLNDVIHKHFPEADLQRCVVHKIRNVLNKVRPREKAIIASDLKELFNNFDTEASREKAKKKLANFCDRWREVYPAVANAFAKEDLACYFTYIKYPVAVRGMIYTTNSIENLNRQIRKVTKTKVSFDKADNLLDVVFMVIKDFEGHHWQKYPVHGFKYWSKKTLLD